MTSIFNSERFIDLPDAELYYDPFFLDKRESDLLFNRLLNEVGWSNNEILIFGKRIKEPRLTASFGEADKKYGYSGINIHCQPWKDELLTLKKKIEHTITDRLLQIHQPHYFNTVLLNLYRNGTDSMGWHSDDEKELGRAPVIASVTLGECRRFLFRRKDDKAKKYELQLSPGSLLIMYGQMQHFWSHSIPKEPQKKEARLNLTYRYII